MDPRGEELFKRVPKTTAEQSAIEQTKTSKPNDSNSIENDENKPKIENKVHKSEADNTETDKRTTSSACDMKTDDSNQEKNSKDKSKESSFDKTRRDEKSIEEVMQRSSEDTQCDVKKNSPANRKQIYENSSSERPPGEAQTSVPIPEMGLNKSEDGKSQERENVEESSINSSGSAKSKSPSTGKQQMSSENKKQGAALESETENCEIYKKVIKVVDDNFPLNNDPEKKAEILKLIQETITYAHKEIKRVDDKFNEKIIFIGEEKKKEIFKNVDNKAYIHDLLTKGDDNGCNEDNEHSDDDIIQIKDGRISLEKCEKNSKINRPFKNKEGFFKIVDDLAKSKSANCEQNAEIIKSIRYGFENEITWEIGINPQNIVVMSCFAIKEGKKFVAEFKKTSNVIDLFERVFPNDIIGYFLKIIDEKQKNVKFPVLAKVLGMINMHIGERTFGFIQSVNKRGDFVIKRNSMYMNYEYIKSLQYIFMFKKRDSGEIRIIAIKGLSVSNNIHEANHAAVFFHQISCVEKEVIALKEKINLLKQIKLNEIQKEDLLEILKDIVKMTNQLRRDINVAPISQTTEGLLAEYLNKNEVVGELIHDPKLLEKVYSKKFKIIINPDGIELENKRIMEILIENEKNIDQTVYRKHPLQWGLVVNFAEFINEREDKEKKNLIAADALLHLFETIDEIPAMFPCTKADERLGVNEAEVHIRSIKERLESVEVSEFKILEKNGEKHLIEEKLSDNEFTIIINESEVPIRLTHRSIKNFESIMNKVIANDAFPNFVVIFENFIRFINDKKLDFQPVNYELPIKILVVAKEEEKEEEKYWCCFPW